MMQEERGRSEIEDHQLLLSVSRPTLPQEIMEEILNRLPAKPLIRFRCVNKLFKSLLTCNSNFIKKRILQTYLNEENEENEENKRSFILKFRPLQFMAPNEFYYIPNGAFDKAENIDTFVDYPRFVGSSNGLLCLSDSRNALLFVLWNPLIYEFKRLPLPHSGFEWLGRASLGFGFHPSLNDYKVVRIVTVATLKNENEKSTSHIQVEVYSLSTDSWSRLGDFPPYVFGDSEGATTMNGVNHWIVSHQNSSKKLILSFDMGNDVFGEVPIPELVSDPFFTSVLRVFRGCLSLFVGNDVIAVLVMKEYGVLESWTTLFTIELEKVIDRPLNFWNDDEMLVQKAPAELVLYNLKSRKMKNLLISSFEVPCPSIVDVVPHVESLALMAHKQAAPVDNQML